MKNSKIFHILAVNKNARAGKIAVQVAQQQYATRKFALANELQILQAQYASGVATLQQYDLNHLEVQRQKFDKAFADGRVSNDLLIESSRQMFESFKTYHQYEMNTLQTLWRIYALQRRLLSNMQEASHETC